MSPTIFKYFGALSCLATMSCTTQIEEKVSLDYQPVYPIQSAPALTQASGTIYSAASGGLLKLDKRARKVGDVLTVAFVESFQATKSQNASTNRSTANEIDLPDIIPNSDIMADISSALQSSSENSFSGSGSTAQSNSLTGQMSVSIIRVLPGGNVEISGQKRLILNKGDEYIRVTGIVRPMDISSDNIVSSDRIANANIQYIGAGSISDSSKIGWLGGLLSTVSPI